MHTNTIENTRKPSKNTLRGQTAINVKILDEDHRIAAYQYDGNRPYIIVWTLPGIRFNGECGNQHEFPSLNDVFTMVTNLEPCFCTTCRQGVVQIVLQGTENPAYVEWYNSVYAEYNNQ